MNIDDMDLNLLRALDALILERSVSRAAERVDLSQPAMSNALRRLRSLLDDQLLVRSGNQMVPTPRALEIQPVVRSALDELSNALFGTADFDPRHHTAPITIATTDGDVSKFGANLHRQLREAGVQVPLRFINLDPSYAQTLLESGAVSLAVGAIDMAPETLQQMRLDDETFCCVMRNDHKLAGHGLSLENYLASEHILVAPMGGAPRGLIDSALEREGHVRRIALVVPSFLAALELTQSTDLLATLPAKMVAKWSNSANLYVTSPDYLGIGIRMRAFWHERFGKSPFHIWLRQELFKAYKTGSR
ncbi:MAG: LysR family transcriptional regulator [Pseudomonadota bacterium]